jgi:hypothetical protein
VAALAPSLREAPRVVDRPSQWTTRVTAEDKAKFDQILTLAALPPEKPDAALKADEPRLKSAPQPVQRGLGRLSTAGLEASGLSPNAVIAPPTAATFVAAPAFDEEHPDELAYRPFPIAPFLTASPSFDDPALAVMTHPDHQKTLDLLDAAGGMPPMRLRPTERGAVLMMAQTFQGTAINIQKAFAEPDRTPGDTLKPRAVSTR